MKLKLTLTMRWISAKSICQFSHNSLQTLIPFFWQLSLILKFEIEAENMEVLEPLQNLNIYSTEPPYIHERWRISHFVTNLVLQVKSCFTYFGIIFNTRAYWLTFVTFVKYEVIRQLKPSINLFILYCTVMAIVSCLILSKTRQKIQFVLKWYVSWLSMTNFVNQNI